MSHALVELSHGVPDQVRNILAVLPGVSVRVADGPNRLALISGGLRPFAATTAPMLAALAGRRAQLGLVVADRLRGHVRKELEDAGCAYADATGAAHIAVPGFYLHVQGDRARSRTLVPAPAGIGVTGVRVVQVL